MDNTPSCKYQEMKKEADFQLRQTVFQKVHLMFLRKN